MAGDRAGSTSRDKGGTGGPSADGGRIDELSAPAFVYSEDGVLRDANEAALDLLGAEEREQVVGSDAGRFTAPEDEERRERRHRTLVEEGLPVPPVEERIVGLDGRTRRAVFASTPATVDGESVIRTVATEVTDRRRREHELRQRNEHLEDFARVLSHDLRNPLEIARGNLELAREDDDPGRLETVADALDRMDEMIEDTRSLVEAGRRVEDPDPVDLATVARRCWDRVATDEATLVIDGDLEFSAVASRLDHLFENLYRNAVEHGSASPPSHAREDAVEHGGENVTIRVGPLSGNQGFYVEDDGPGIPTEDRESVFDVGHSKNGGTGFGLSIVEKVAAAHGWSVRVTDAEAGNAGASGSPGARFEVTGVDALE